MEGKAKMGCQELINYFVQVFLKEKYEKNMSFGDGIVKYTFSHNNNCKIQIVEKSSSAVCVRENMKIDNQILDPQKKVLHKIFKYKTTFGQVMNYVNDKLQSFLLI